MKIECVSCFAFQGFPLIKTDGIFLRDSYGFFETV